MPSSTVSIEDIERGLQEPGALFQRSLIDRHWLQAVPSSNDEARTWPEEIRFR